MDYLAQDKKALHIKKENNQRWLGDPIWKYQRVLRRVEYLQNVNRDKWQYRIELKLNTILFRLLGMILGFTIYPNNFGPGLSIAHRGTIVVNEKARIGSNCRLHTCVNIGTNMGEGDTVPIIGDNVYIGPGVKIFGKIHIADNIAIGANAVVNKSFLQKGITIAGIPARKISDKGSPGITIG